MKPSVNASKFFYTGESAFAYLIDTFSKAKTSIEIQMFIWRDDEIGQLMAQAILEAADRGVRVHVEKDLLGGIFEYAEEYKRSFFHPHLPYLYGLQAKILDLAYPMPNKPNRVKQEPCNLYRALLDHPNIILNCNKALNNHSKYYIIDQEILVVSGMNIEFKEWKHDLLGRPYRDYMAAFHSQEAVQAFKSQLAMGGVKHRDLYGHGAINLASEMPIDVICNAPVEGKMAFHARSSILQRLKQAKHSLVIAMAYIGDHEIHQALLELIERRVSVQVFLPKKANLQNDLNLMRAAEILKKSRGQLELYLCDHMIHGKLFVIDHHYISFGSTNFNKQAMTRLQEVNVGLFLDQYGWQEDWQAAYSLLKNNSNRIYKVDQIAYNKFTAFIETLS